MDVPGVVAGSNGWRNFILGSSGGFDCRWVCDLVGLTGFSWTDYSCRSDLDSPCPVSGNEGDFFRGGGFCGYSSAAGCDVNRGWGAFSYSFAWGVRLAKCEWCDPYGGRGGPCGRWRWERDQQRFLLGEPPHESPR